MGWLLRKEVVQVAVVHYLIFRRVKNVDHFHVIEENPRLFLLLMMLRSMILIVLVCTIMMQFLQRTSTTTVQVRKSSSILQSLKQNCKFSIFYTHLVRLNVP